LAAARIDVGESGQPGAQGQQFALALGDGTAGGDTPILGLGPAGWEAGRHACSPVVR
jgi:hypothetical protein